jgi:NAD(P)-dependent dehydrogenase (short-subunit alcohol dehydrogenase family)
MQPYLDLFRGTYFLSQAVVEQLRDQAQTSHSSRDNGSVVFISTMFAQGFIGQFPCSAVGAIKAAYSGLTRNVCQELAAYGIRVNTVDLGVIETSIYGLDENGLSALRKMQPLEINGKPEDVSETVRHLTERSPFTTGQIVTMDGGVTAGHYAGSC